MSKRRKREAEEKTEEEEKTEGASKSESEKPEGKGTKKIMFYSIVVAVIFFGIGFFFNPVLTGYSIAAPDTTETGDQFIFISPPGCTNCAELEPLARGVANTLGLPFMKTGFGQQIPTPGFVLIYDNVLTVSGFQDEYTLKNQVCVLTKDEDVCSQAENLSPPEQQPQPPAPDFPKRDEPENPEIKTFFDSGADICYEDGKPVIRMYASSGCGYCNWNKPMYEKVVKEYMDQGKILAYLWEDGKNILSDEQEAMPPEEEALRQQYGFTGVPAFIFGCKYYRGGAGNYRAENNVEVEEAELRVVIEDLLGG